MRGEVESAKPQQGIQPSIKTSFSASETREPTGRAELQGEYLENSPSSSDAKPPGSNLTHHFSLSESRLNLSLFCQKTCLFKGI